MDLAAGTLLASGRGRGLIASTDADSVVAPDWLRTQLDLVAGGADAIGGAIDLSGDSRTTWCDDGSSGRSGGW